MMVRPMISSPGYPKRFIKMANMAAKAKGEIREEKNMGALI